MEATTNRKDSKMQGSVFNRLAEASRQPEPCVGMPATIMMYTDRVAAIVTEVSLSGKSITIAKVAARRADDNGMSECQTYEYGGEPVVGGTTWTFRKNGRWAMVGEPMSGGPGLALGFWDAYYDYSF